MISKNEQRVLFFLLVNGRGYPTEIHRRLSTPLTPLQKALGQLEKGGVVTSFYEGKMRLYRFNPLFPLLAELEQMLRKAFSLLGSAEQKLYDPPFDRLAVIEEAWHKLSRLKRLAIQAKIGPSEVRSGKGEVAVSAHGKLALVFQEKGSWIGGGAFSNALRWTFDPNEGLISLEHLRRGAEHPVFLFHLAPTGASILSSLDPHVCGDDAYFGKIHFDRHTLRLTCRVIGPKKNEEIESIYT